MSTIESRLDRLERAAWQWRIAALTLAGTFAALVSCEPASPARAPQAAAVAAAVAEAGPVDVLQVRRLEVVNEEGHVLASLGVDSHTRGGELTVFRGAGAPNGQQRTSVNGLGMSISDDEQTSVVLSAVGPGSGSLSCPGRNGERTTINPGGVRVYREHRRPDLDTLSREEARQLLDDDNALAVSIGTTDLGGGILSIFSPLDEMVATVQSDKRNSGLIGAYNANGDPIGALTDGE